MVTAIRRVAPSLLCACLPLLGSCDSPPPAGEEAAREAAGPAEPDLRRGELLSLACEACHTLTPGGADGVGPNLHGIFGRRAAAGTGFEYSPALRASGLVWTPEAVEAWLADPAGFIAGTTMAFTGYRSPRDRRDLVAYLIEATDGSAAE